MVRIFLSLLVSEVVISILPKSQKKKRENFSSQIPMPVGLKLGYDAKQYISTRVYGYGLLDDRYITEGMSCSHVPSCKE